MIRRRLILFIISAVLWAPMGAFAVPRPSTFTRTQNAESQVGPSITVNADGHTYFTPILELNRSYRLEITGTWKYSANSCDYADMAYQTSDCWATKRVPNTGAGLEVNGQDQAGNPPAVGYSADHKYSISLGGAGQSVQLRIFDQNYTDDAGALTVRVLQAAQVTYSWPIVEDANGIPVIYSPAIQAVVLPVPITVTTPGIGVPSTPLPVLATLSGSHNPAGQYCVSINGIQPIPCQPDPGRVLGQPSYYPDGTIVLGGNQQRDIFPPINYSFPITSTQYIAPIDLTAIARNIVPGGLLSGGRFIVKTSWQADRSHLYQWVRDPFLGTSASGWLPVNPSNSSEVSWYSNKVAASQAVILQHPYDAALYLPADNVDAVIQVTGVTASGYPLFDYSVVIPGLGQLLEAGFQTTAFGLG